MPNYKYKAINDTGSTVAGVVAAASPDEARTLIAAKGLIPTKVAKGGGGGGGASSLNNPAWMDDINAKLAKVKAPDLMLFTKQFKTMFEAGVNVSRILEILEQQTDNLKLKKAIGIMIKDIRGGSNLYTIFKKHPGCFDDMYCRMIRAGEVSGNLPQVLDRLVYLVDHEFKIRKKIKSAMTYPTIVIVMLTGAFLFLLTFVMPQFIQMFSKAGIELPWPTKVCMTMHHYITTYWHVGLLGVIGAIAGLIAYCRTDQGKYVRDKILLMVPLIGPVMQKAAMSRFSSIFAILQSSGVSILESVNVISRTIGNEAISREFDGLEQKLKEGRGIAAPLKQSKYFTPMVINMVAIGEESGNLDEMLTEVSVHYDYEVEYSVDRMADMITPILTLALAGVVGFFAMSIMLPIFDLMKMAQH